MPPPGPRPCTSTSSIWASSGGTHPIAWSTEKATAAVRVSVASVNRFLGRLEHHFQLCRGAEGQLIISLSPMVSPAPEAGRRDRRQDEAVLLVRKEMRAEVTKPRQISQLELLKSTQARSAWRTSGHAWRIAPPHDPLPRPPDPGRAGGGWRVHQDQALHPPGGVAGNLALRSVDLGPPGRIPGPPSGSAGASAAGAGLHGDGPLSPAPPRVMQEAA
jgi:hypothetical protein